MVRPELILAVATILASAGCIGTPGQDTPAEAEPADANQNRTTNASRPSNTTIAKETTILVGFEATTCADQVPRCGGAFWSSQTRPFTVFGITGENATVNVTANWTPSTPLSETLRLTVTNAENEILVDEAGPSPLAATFQASAGECTASVGTDPQPLASATVDQEIAYAIRGPVDER